MKKNIITIFMVVLMGVFCNFLFADTPEEQMDRGLVFNHNLPDPGSQSAFDITEYDLQSIPKSTPPSGELAPLIATYDVEALTGSNLCLGVEYAFGYLWVTNAGTSSASPPNYLVKIDISGPTPVVVNTYTQTSTTGWGWRDMCSDGTYLYASEGTSIIQIDPNTGSPTGVTIPSPINPARALAYDPATDHFWTISFSTNLFEIDRNGTIIHSFPNPVSSYGAGWDPYSVGGPFLWLNAGTSTGDTYHMDQVNPVTGTLTGVSHIGTTGAIAGGLDVDVDIVPGKIAAVALGQGTPDIVDVWDFGDYGDPTDPLPPTNFIATSEPSTPTSMLLTWTDPSNYINGNPLTNFQIIIARDGSVIDSVNSGVQTYTNTGLTQYQEYTYEIWAKDYLDSTSSKVSATWMAGGYIPIMVVDPLALGDTLLIGATSQHEFTIYNNQSHPASLNYTITENPSVTWLSVTPTSGTVTPNGNQVITVDIVTAGMAAGTYTTDLVVAGDDPFNPEDIVVFTLQVNEPPIIGFSPDSLHFTLDPTGVAYSVIDSSQITITNTGTGPLNWATAAAAPELMYYKFDEAGANQTQNFAQSTSPVPATAQVLGLTMGGTGYTGAALIGNAGSSSTNYVDTGWPTNLSGSWTIAMWINNMETTSASTRYFFGDNTASSFRCFVGGVAGNGNLLLRGTGISDVLVSGVAPGPSEVVFVYDDAALEFRAYLNGQLVNTVAQATPIVLTGTSPFKVGGYSTFTGLPANCLLDEFKMYNRAIDVTDASRQGWLATNPQSGIIPPGGSQNVWVIANSTGLIGGEYKGGVHISSNDPVHPDTTLPVGLTVFGTPQISVNPLTLTFDTLLVGGSQTLPVTVSNTGSFPLNVTNITTTHADFTATPLSFTVGVGASQTVDVTFHPSVAQVYSESMSIYSDDPVNPIVGITLNGVANEAPVIAVAPDSMHFDLFSGEEDSLQFTISNLGNGPLSFELTDEDLPITFVTAQVDRSYLRPEYEIELPKDAFDWRVGTPQTEGAGGPDLFGYKWIDSDEPGGPIPNYIDISGTGTILTFSSQDDGVAPIALPFSVKFYGQDYSNVLVSTNGWISFNTTYTSSYLTNAQIPSTALPNNIIAATWDDLNGNNVNSHVYYQQIGNKFIIQFHNWNRYGNTGGDLNFQYVLQQNSEKIELQYATMNYGTGTLNSYTVGIENADGTDGLNVVFNAAYLHSNMAILFARESQWLSENPASGVVPAGGSVNIWAIVNSSNLVGGDYLAAVVINSNDPVNPQVKLPKVSMHVTGIPRISVTPSPLVFDTCLVGATPQLELTVANVGTDQLNVTNITSSNPVFTPNPTTLSIAPFSSEIVTVTFAPVTAGSFSGQLDFTSNDPLTPTVSVPVSGAATEAPVIAVFPDTFDVTLTPDSSTTRILTISNLGNGPLNFEISSVGVLEKNHIDLTPAYQQKLNEILRKRTVVNSPVNAKAENIPDQNKLFMLPDVIDGEEIFGSMGTTWSGTLRDRGNIFQVTTATTLTEHKMYLDITTPTPMYFFVYRGTAVTGTFNKINEVFIASSGTGQGFYSSGPIQVQLEAGYYYYLGASWEGNVTYYRGTETVPIPCSFGFLSTGIPGNIAGGYPPAATANNASYTNFSPYYCAVVTGAGTSWLSFDITSGQIPPGGSQDITVTFDPTGLLGGDYRANIVVENNDPINPEVLVGTHMLVIGQAVVSHTPDPVVMDTTFTGAVNVQSLWVRNTGSDTLRVTNILSTNPVFAVDTTHFTVAPPLDSFRVRVSFSPVIPGDYQGYLLIESNDPVTPVDSVTVVGVAAEAPLAVVSPNFVNPVFVPMGDSTDIFINLGNAGGSPLVWTAFASNVPATTEGIKLPIYGPKEALEFADISPSLKSKYGVNIDALWDLQFSFNLELASGALGNAGAEFDGTYYYTTRWASNLLHKYDMAGTLVEEFSISGVTGLRDLAFDGTYMYGGAAANTIYMMDFNTKTLIGTIPSPVAVRNIAYDSENDAFWVGNWNTDLVLVSRTGATLASIPATSHGLAGMYGSAYDNWSDGGPYLWVFDQGSGQGYPQYIHQINIATGTLTGVSHDVTLEFPAVSGIAGGLFTAEGIVPGKASIGGVLQGTPDMFFVYELTETAPDWIKVLVTGGSIAPMDQFDIPVRIYQNNTPGDTAYVIINTNDPALPVTSILVIRTMVTGLGDLNALPTTYEVSQNYPNPFNPSTTIKYQLPEISNVKLVIYNVLGQKVRTLLSDRIEAGYHSVVWDGRNDEGRAVASGIYIYKFEAGNFNRTMKLMILK